MTNRAHKQKYMVLVVATSKKTRGGITSVIKAHKTGSQWKKFHCVWIQTNRDGKFFIKLAYLFFALLEYILLLPFCNLVHIHCTLGTSGKRKLVFAKLAKVLNKKLIVHFHPSNEKMLQDPTDHKIGKKLFSLADCVLTLSPQWIRWINEAYPNNNFKMKVLWNPCSSVVRRDDVRKKQILYAGTLIKRKGYDTLLYAFGKIALQYPDWKLLFAGNPYLKDGINELEHGKKIADELKISSQVRWLGWISGKDKERVFQESSIYCLASDGEGFPMGVLDAWAYGIPCIMTPVGGIPDIVINGQNGLLFPIGEIDVLASQIQKLIEDSKLRKSIVTETDKYVNGVFSISNITKCLDDIYSELIIVS